jgi:hypothetical protein
MEFLDRRVAARPRPNISSGWPYSHVNLAMDDTPVDEEFVGQLVRLFELVGGYVDIAKQLAYVG